MRARAFSGSSSSISSVAPLISANSAVIILRSPSIEDASACSAATRTAGVETTTAGDLSEPSGTFSGEAHSPQNFEVGAFSKPHLPHRRPNGAAHSLQNLRPTGFSAPHFAQRIVVPALPHGRGN